MAEFLDAMQEEAIAERDAQKHCQRDKVWLGDIWRSNRWDGMSPASRVETCYDREILHEFEIETMAQLWEKLDSNWQRM